MLAIQAAKLKKPAVMLLVLLLIGAAVLSFSLLSRALLDSWGLQYRSLAIGIAYALGVIWVLTFLGALIWLVAKLFGYPQAHRALRILQKTACTVLIMVLLCIMGVTCYLSLFLFAFGVPKEETVVGTDGVTYIDQYAPTDPVDSVPYYRAVNPFVFETEPAEDILYYEAYTGTVLSWHWAGGDNGMIRIFTVDVGDGKILEFQLKGLAFDTIPGIDQVDTGNRVEIRCKRYSILKESPYIITDLTVL